MITEGINYGDGRVGIGTTTPMTSLHVTGTPGHSWGQIVASSLEGEGDVVTFNISSAFYDYERQSGIYCNMSSHRAADLSFSSDTGFQFSTDKESNVTWMQEK